MVIHSAIEKQLVRFFQSQSFTGTDGRIYETANILVNGAGEIEQVTTPAIFVIAKKGDEMTEDSGRYTVPIEVRTVYTTEDMVVSGSDAIGILHRQVELSLTGSKDAINNAASNTSVFLYRLLRQGSEMQQVENTYQNVTYVQAIAKNK